MAAYAVSTTACVTWPAAVSNTLTVEPPGEGEGVTWYFAPLQTVLTSPCSGIALVLVTISYPAAIWELVDVKVGMGKAVHFWG